MKKNYLIMSVFLACFSILSCTSDPSDKPAEESAREANENPGNSSSDTQFNTDTTINIESGGGAGMPVGEADSIANSGKAASQ